VTKRLAEAWLRDVLDQARGGPLLGMGPTGATFAEAAAEYLGYVADERGCKPTTVRDYRSILDAHLLPRFGAQRVEDITPTMVEEWRASLAPTWRAVRSTCGACRTQDLVRRVPMRRGDGSLIVLTTRGALEAGYPASRVPRSIGPSTWARLCGIRRMYTELTEDEGPLAGLIYITAREDVAQLVCRATDAAWLPHGLLSFRTLEQVIEQTRNGARAMR
jgi:Phage integrase, N-terminal SAM-like domain